MYLFIQCVTGGGGMGSGWVESNYMKLCTVYLTRFRTYKIVAHHPKQKPGGLRQINTCRQSLYRSIFKKRRLLGFGVFIVIWSIKIETCSKRWWNSLILSPSSWQDRFSSLNSFRSWYNGTAKLSFYFTCSKRWWNSLILSPSSWQDRFSSLNSFRSWCKYSRA